MVTMLNMRTNASRVRTSRMGLFASFVAVALVASAIAAGEAPAGSAHGRAPHRVGTVSLLRASSPSAPRAPKAIGGNGHATVMWTAPRHVNGSRINAYLVWPFVGKKRLKAREFHSKKTSQVVTGLANGKKYTFRVAARNGVGIGPKSGATGAVWVRSVAHSAPRRAHWAPSSAAPISWNWQLQGNGAHEHRREGLRHRRVHQLGRDCRRVARARNEGHLLHRLRQLGELPARLRVVPGVGAGELDNGWPGEKWLDIRQIGVLAPIMTARMRMCVQKGFDALEPDNIDGYSNSTGFPLTAQDQLNYNVWIANTAHSLGLSVGLKNDTDQTSQLVPYFDWALNEQCNEYSECDTENVFVRSNKAVFNAEYSGDTGFCSADESEHINGAAFDLNLDGGSYQPCTGGW